MSKEKTQQRLSPEQILNLGADKLAAEHQQRLHQMTRAAIYGKVKKSQRPGFALWPVPMAVSLPVLSLMAVTLVWQLTQQSETTSLQPVVAMKEGVPGWVKDADVPLAVIENVEFYQWLEKELNNEDHS